MIHLKHYRYSIEGINAYQPNCGALENKHVTFVSMMFVAAVCTIRPDKLTGTSFSENTVPAIPPRPVTKPEPITPRTAEPITPRTAEPITPATTDPVIPFTLVCGTNFTFPSSTTGAEPATLGEFPWTATFGRYSTVKEQTHLWMDYTCVGTLITDQYVITAAKCLTNKYTSKLYEGAMPFMVRLGIVIKNPTDDNRQYLKDYNVIQYVYNEEFGSVMFNESIALLKLSPKVEFNDYIRPICLPTAEDRQQRLVDLIAETIGWGKLNRPGVVRTLKKENVRVVETGKCLNRPLGADAPDAGNRLLCTEGPETVGSYCHDDIGAPLMLTPGESFTGRWTLAGVSMAELCNLPTTTSVFHNVYDAMGWILDHIDT